MLLRQSTLAVAIVIALSAAAATTQVYASYDSAPPLHSTADSLHAADQIRPK